MQIVFTGEKWNLISTAHFQYVQIVICMLSAQQHGTFIRYEIAEHGTFIQSFTYLSRLRTRERLRDKDRDSVKERQRN